MRNFFASLIRDPLGLVGAALTTASALVFLALFTLELVGFHTSPYVGILAYLILPAVFLLGLALIPIGVLRHRRRLRAAEKSGEAPPPDFPILDLNRERTRRNVLIFLALTLVNLVLLAAATYKGVETMESTEFCGQACHSVMAPEYAAYKVSPHSQVACVECHIGPGAESFVRAKLNGAWQVVSVNLNLYPQPIPSPIHEMRPAREICGQCHALDRPAGQRLEVIPKFEEDETNTRLETVLWLQDVHWHVHPDRRVRYRSDPERRTIYEVELTDTDGTVQVFQPPQPPEEGVEVHEWRTMDCFDCHNRPSHTFEPAGKAMDRALAEGRIDPGLPFVKREGLAAITAEYATHDEAREGIAAHLQRFYEEQHPEVVNGQAGALAHAVETLQTIYTTNVFPSMKVAWGTYPNHLGHDLEDERTGCFRCHDDEHATEDGEVISGSDCFEACHNLIAMDEEQPEILGQLEP